MGGETTAQELRVTEGIQYAYVPTSEPQTDEVQVLYIHVVLKEITICPQYVVMTG